MARRNVEQHGASRPGPSQPHDPDGAPSREDISKTVVANGGNPSVDHPGDAATGAGPNPRKVRNSPNGVCTSWELAQL